MNNVSKYQEFYKPFENQISSYEKENPTNPTPVLDHLEDVEVKKCTVMVNFANQYYNSLDIRINDIENRFNLNCTNFEDISKDRLKLYKLEMKVERFKIKCPNESSFDNLKTKINKLKKKINNIIEKKFIHDLDLSVFKAKNSGGITISEARQKYDEKSFQIFLSNTKNTKSIDRAFEIAKITPHLALRCFRLARVSEAYLYFKNEEGCKKAFKANKMEYFYSQNRILFLGNMVLGNRNIILDKGNIGFIFKNCLEVKTLYTIHLARKILDNYSEDMLKFCPNEVVMLKAFEEKLDSFYQENRYIHKVDPSIKIFDTLWRGIFDVNSYMYSDSFPREVIGVIFQKCLKS